MENLQKQHEAMVAAAAASNSIYVGAPLPARNMDPKTAPEFLAKAQSLLTERGKQYDQAAGERSMGKCIAAFNIITGKDLTEAEGWLLMEVLKNVRQWSRPGYHRDSAEDCVSYAALKAEALAGAA